MSFKEIINQEQVVTFLTAVHQHNRIAGAYLFLGKEGNGREKMAREFAKLINCSTASDDCCDTCSSCITIKEDKHVDVHWYRPVNNAITISQMRDLQKYIYLKPFELKKKVFIVCDAQCLSEESSNALLKTLEEPPQDSIIILISSQAKALLATVRSRCQKIIFNALDEVQVKDILIEHYCLVPARAHLISYLVQGNMKNALAFMDFGDDLLQKRSHILNAVYFKKFAVFKMEEFNIKDNTLKRKRVNLLLDILLAWFRDLLVIKTRLDIPLINMDKKQELLRYVSQYTQEDLTQCISTVANAKYLIAANFNLNVKLAITKMRADLWK